MAKSTKELLVAAASKLLDQGGQDAVTLRAVAEIVGVSHNAPYRHFQDRSALLAAVADGDFHELEKAFREQNRKAGDAEKALRKVTRVFIAFSQKHPARYQLMASDPDLPSNPKLKTAALAPFLAFREIVERCQKSGVLPEGDSLRMAGMIYATLHGAIDLGLSGRGSDAKGVDSAEKTIGLLIGLLKKR